MAGVDREYFYLEEIETRWEMGRRGITYLAENGMVVLSLRVFDVTIERGRMIRSADGTLLPAAEERACITGLFDVAPAEAFRLFRRGRAAVSAGHAEAGRYCRLMTPDALDVQLDDLVIRKAERERVETIYGLAPELTALEGQPPVIVAEDGRSVRIGNDVIALGPVQAEVVRLLCAAAAAGTPWQDGKALLRDAGSNSIRMSDLFKRWPNWRRIILSDRRGRYRIRNDSHTSPRN